MGRRDEIPSEAQATPKDALLCLGGGWVCFRNANGWFAMCFRSRPTDCDIGAGVVGSAIARASQLPSTEDVLQSPSTAGPTDCSIALIRSFTCRICVGERMWYARCCLALCLVFSFFAACCVAALHRWGRRMVAPCAAVCAPASRSSPSATAQPCFRPTSTAHR